MVFLGNPEYVADLQPIDFAEFAHACGALGFTVEDPEQCSVTLGLFLVVPPRFSVTGPRFHFLSRLIRKFTLCWLIPIRLAKSCWLSLILRPDSSVWTN